MANAILNDIMAGIEQKFWEAHAEEQRRVERFEAIDFGRLLYDKKYQAACDAHFGEGWMDRIKYKW